MLGYMDLTAMRGEGVWGNWMKEGEGIKQKYIYTHTQTQKAMWCQRKGGGGSG